MGLPDGEVEARDKRFQELFFDPNNKYNEIINKMGLKGIACNVHYK